MSISTTQVTVLDEPTFAHISVKPLHPTFAAEISGIDFKSPLSDDTFKEVYQAVTKACLRIFFPGIA